MEKETPQPPSAFTPFAPKTAATGAFEHPSTPYNPESFARAWGLFLQAADAKEPRTDDFTWMVNPSSVAVRALIFTGLPPRSPAAPNDDADEFDAKPSPARRAWALARNASLHSLLEMAPGAKLLVPRSWISALVRTSADGSMVIGGLAPSLRLVTDPSPPTLHPSLIVDEAEPFAVPK